MTAQLVLTCDGPGCSRLLRWRAKSPNLGLPVSATGVREYSPKRGLVAGWKFTTKGDFCPDHAAAAPGRDRDQRNDERLKP